jgi:L-ascorbate metabolism protein UlaG (beta-lactamase superfamily)
MHISTFAWKRSKLVQLHGIFAEGPRCRYGLLPMKVRNPLAEITWLGYDCFRIKSRDVTVITDPYDKSLGLGTLNQKAEIVTISHEYPGSNKLSGIKGDPFVITSPGEYEVGGVFVTGIGAFTDKAGEDKERTKNNVFVMLMHDVVVCHLGALGHTLNAQQLEVAGDVDVLLVPVGGQLSTSKAAEVISQVGPRIVVPMHFSGGKATTEPDALDKFMKELGLKEWKTQEKLVVRATESEEPMQVVVLEVRS